MDVNNEDTGDEEIYYYQLVEFVSRGRRGKRKVDIVPSFWPVYNPQKSRMETPFLPPPYTEESFEMFTQFVKDKIPPLKTWPMYTVKLVGRAKTYEAGMEKLSLLQDDDDVVYTADLDFNPIERAAYVVNTYKEKVKQSDLPKIPAPRTIVSSSSDDTDSSSWATEQLKTIVKSGKGRLTSNKKSVAKKTKNKTKPKGDIKPPKATKKNTVVVSGNENVQKKRDPIDREIEKKKSCGRNTSEKQFDKEFRFEKIYSDPPCNLEISESNGNSEIDTAKISSEDETGHTFFGILDTPGRDCNENNSKNNVFVVDKRSSKKTNQNKNRIELSEASTSRNEDSSRCPDSFNMDKREKTKHKSTPKDKTKDKRISSGKICH